MVDRKDIQRGLNHAKQVLLGKSKLIQEYQEIARAILQERMNIAFAKSQGWSYQNIDKYEEIWQDYQKLIKPGAVKREKKAEVDDNPAVLNFDDSSFDYWNESRKSLKERVELGRGILEKYNIRCPNIDLKHKDVQIQLGYRLPDRIPER